jgi:hypothetical protein
MVQNRAHKSKVHIGFRTPPPVLPLTEGGGGPELVITRAHIWTARKRALKSKVHIGFRTPPVRSAFNGRGGGPEWVLRSALRSAVRKPARRSMDHDGFRTPLGVLLLIKGGGGVRKEYSWQRALFTVGIVLLVRKSFHLMPPDSLHHSGMSSSTKSTCPTCSRVESHPITAVSPCCQAFTLSIHDQPPSATFTSNHMPPRHSSVCFGHRHLPPHP